ncbi:MAG: HAD-IIIA family hydrolase [Planctomycetes bacterium]|nr:HAD-IIIA family hydrolase [Planctomycetota bacterium]
MKKPAVFLDRDGTLIEDAGFLRDVAQVDFYPQTFLALRRLADFVLFIVTNQSGIAKGHICIEEARAVNDYVVRRLAEAGSSIQAVYCCPHQRTDGCACMKPSSYFLRVAERDHEIDLTRSFVVGDHPSDVELAHAVGAKGIYVLTGHGVKHCAELKVPGIVVADIGAAADVILGTHAIGVPKSRLICAS